jgi:bifunctional DNase/RNase
MSKVQVEILGLSASPASTGAYALILKETHGSRRLPIVIGAFEAQAIAFEMEGIKPPRPLTHDLLKALLDTLGSTLVEVCINNLTDGTFHAQLVLDGDGVEVDARPSDAVALAVRCQAPIFVTDEVMDEVGFTPEDADEEMDEEDMEGGDSGAFGDESEDELFQQPKFEKPKPETMPTSKIDQLRALMNKAISSEDYERAAQLRDEIQKMLGTSQ